MNKKTVSIVVTANGGQARREAKKTGDAFVDMNRRAAQQAQQIGQSLQMSGAALTAALTAPLAGLATLGVKSALSLDQARTKLTALLGSVEAANSRMAALQKLASESVGVLFKGALETDTQLRSAGIKTEKTIDTMIKALGKLNAAFTIEDQGGFIRNLGQIFKQGFEIQDIKEVLGRVPIFDEILKTAFGTNDPEALRKLKDSGKLTAESWMTSLAGAIEQHPATKNITDNLSTKLAKGMERADVALAPLGDVILKVIVPALEKLVPYVQQAGAWFQSLGPTVQVVVVAIGALAAALGPALVILGAVVGAIGALVEAAVAVAAAVGGFAALGAVILGIGVILAEVAAGVAIFYAAWTTNFGGIRELAQTVADALVSAWDTAMAELTSLTADVTAEITRFWEENGADIMAAVNLVSGQFRLAWEQIVGWIRDNWDTISGIISAAWTVIKTIVVNGIKILGGVIKVISGVIQGDWSKAWEGVKQITSAVWDNILAILSSAGTAIVGAIKLAIDAIWSLASWIRDNGVRLGKELISGLIQGLVDPGSKGLLQSAARALIMTPLSIMRQTADSHSPSRETKKIGGDLVEGLALGLDPKKAIAAAKKLAKDTIDELKKAREEFLALAGATPATVARMGQAAEAQQMAADLREIIELRNRFGENATAPLPKDRAGIDAELEHFKKLKKEADDFKKLLEELEDAPKKMQEQLDKDAEEQLQNLREIQDRLRETGQQKILDLQEEIALVGVVNEEERARIERSFDLLRLREQMKTDGYAEDQIEEAVQIAEAVNKIAANYDQVLAAKKRAAEASALEKDLKEEIETLKRGSREVTFYEKALQDLAGKYKDLDGAQKQRILDLAREADAWVELRKRQEQVRDVIGTIVDAGLERGWRGILDSIRNMFKQWLRKMLTDWLTSAFFRIFRGGGGGIGSGSGGGIQIPGFPGIGPGGTAPTFPGGGGGIPLPGGSGGVPLGTGSGTTGSSSGGLGGIFGHGPGGLFARPTNPFTGKLQSNFAGTLSGIGAIASMVGGFLPGRLGNVVSMAGMGLSIGAMFGPWGAAIGAAAGGLLGLFMGDPKRKKDKKENLPALRKGFADSISELRQMISDVRRLAMDPEAALSRAREIRGQVASGFGIEFLSKKYKKVAAGEIKNKLIEIDALIKELEGVADISRAAGERARRMVPEFADGGMIPGSRSGMLLRAGEGGFNEFILSTDPSKASRTAGLLAAFMAQYGPAQTAGGITGGETVEIPITIAIDRDGMATGWAKSPAGKKVLVQVVSDAYTNDELKLKRRVG